MNKVGLIGNKFTDMFFIVLENKFSEFEQKGGLFNLLDCFTNCLVDYKLVDHYYSTFVINKFGSSVSLKLIKGSYPTIPIFDKTSYNWLHFAYVNTIKNLDVTQYTSEIKSCDISKYQPEDIVNEEVIKNIEKCDFIFCSERNHPFFNIDSIMRITSRTDKKQYIIFHFPTGSIISNNFNNEELRYYSEKPTQLYPFTVGAGDKFAGYFIDNILNGNTMSSAQEFAHKKTEQWLKEFNLKLI